MYIHVALCVYTPCIYMYVHALLWDVHNYMFGCVLYLVYFTCEQIYNTLLLQFLPGLWTSPWPVFRMSLTHSLPPGSNLTQLMVSSLATHSPVPSLPSKYVHTVCFCVFVYKCGSTCVHTCTCIYSVHIYS